MKICRLEEVECEFSSVGSNEKTRRNTTDKQTEQPETPHHDSFSDQTTPADITRMRQGIQGRVEEP